MNTWFVRCLLGGLLLSSTAALAQDDDDPYAYPDDDPVGEDPRQQTDDNAPPPSRERYERRRKQVDQTEEFRGAAESEGDEDKPEKFERMSGLDDPNTGLAFELVAGALLLDSSRGQFADTLLGLGIRATWEYGRLFDDERLRESLWADLRWTYGNLNDGTAFVEGNTSLHYVTIAPAYELKFGKSNFGVYGQVGGGIAYQSTSIRVDAAETQVNGLKPVIQYGIGLRGRPRISSTGSLSLSFRIEAMAFRRGYMNDFFLGGSFGTAF